MFVCALYTEKKNIRDLFVHRHGNGVIRTADFVCLDPFIGSSLLCYYIVPGEKRQKTHDRFGPNRGRVYEHRARRIVRNYIFTARCIPRNDEFAREIEIRSGIAVTGPLKWHYHYPNSRKRNTVFLLFRRNCVSRTTEMEKNVKKSYPRIHSNRVRPDRNRHI